MIVTPLLLSAALVVGVLLVLGLLLSMFNRFLVKAGSGEALVKTGWGAPQPQVSLSSAFVVPLFNRVETLDLTVKTVRIVRRKQESLSCADGIRAECEVDFYIKINPVEEDIRHVATTIGPARAASIEILRELFEAKFADALKTAGAKLSFDQLYQNRRVFRDEVLRALGQEGDQDVILNGYKLDDVAIQYLEQLPLEMHNEDNVLDARGRKEIAQRTSAEVEAANLRLRQKEVTIAEQNREARLRQLAIEQNIKEQEAKQNREVSESAAREHAGAQKTLAEQERVAEEAKIEKDKALTLASELREQTVRAAEIARERAVELAMQQKQQEVEQAQVSRERVLAVSLEEKTKQTQIARIEREAAEAEALGGKLKMLEQTAIQEAARLRAEEQAQTAKALEIASRQKQIDVIEAEKQAAVDRAMQQVRADVAAYELRTTAQARFDAAVLDSQAAEAQATAISTVGIARADAERASLEARNVMNERVLLATLLERLVPMLPELVGQLMKPAEKIDSIRVVHVGGMGTSGGDAPAGGGVMGGRARSGASRRSCKPAPRFRSCANSSPPCRAARPAPTSAAPCARSPAAPPSPMPSPSTPTPATAPRPRRSSTPRPRRPSRSAAPERGVRTVPERVEGPCAGFGTPFDGLRAGAHPPGRRRRRNPGASAASRRGPHHRLKCAASPRSSSPS